MKSRKIVAVLVSAALVFTAFFCQSLPAAAAAEAGALKYFQNPDYTARPMARLWFPDATAGMDPNDVVEKQIRALADAGFGGVEVAMLSDTGSYNNEETDVAGWGTKNWVNLLKKIYRAAAKVDGGFVVDLTISAHWPPCVNTIDPNDRAASQETSVAFTKLTTGTVTAGNVTLTLPGTKTADGRGAPFLFTDTLIGASVAKVTEVTTKGSGANTYEAVKVDYDTLTPLPVSTAAGMQAGIPDEAFFDLNKSTFGWSGTYADAVISAFGTDPRSPSFAGKIDADGNRKRLADIQDTYVADLSGLDSAVQAEITSGGGPVAAGDYVVIGVFYRGTGQNFSGGRAPLMKNRVYVPDYFDIAGIQAVTDFWEENIFSDAELKGLVAANPGSIFEDSIEASVSTNFWTPDMMDKFSLSYAWRDALPFVISDVRVPGGFGSMAGNDVLDFSFGSGSGADAALLSRIYEDYCDKLGSLYLNEHLIPSNDFAKKHGLTFRGQTYDLSGMDIGAAASMVTVPEGDNMTKGDGLRRLSAANNLNNKKYLSMESVTGTVVNRFNWEEVLFELTANYSWGVNRAILHGTPYAKAFNGGVFTGGMGGSGNADWPGWDPFGKSSFGEAYTYRQIYWDKEKTVTDYLSRIQALLQYTKQKVDVAVLQDYHEAFENPSGNSFQSLLDNGYSYNLLTNGLLNSEDARKISGGVISPAGPAYKAVILDQVETLTLSSLNLLLAYADGGIPIILFDCDPATARVYGSDAGKDAQLRAKYQTLQAKSNVKTTSDKAEIPLLLKSLGVNPFARYSIPKLETTLYRDEATKTNYYYLFNNTSLFQGMLSAGSAKAYKDETAAAWGVPIDAPVVTLEGEGVPYVLDPFTGDTRQVGQYQANGDGTVSVRLDTIPGGNAAILALSAGDAFTKQGKIVSSVTGGNDYRILRDSEGGPILRASSNGTWGVQMADGTSVSVTVRDMPGEMNLGASPWNLTLDSYGPKYADAKDLLGADNLQLVDPSETRITRADLGPVSLVSWGALSADASVVKQLIGVSNRSPADVNSATMNNISGRGYYSTSFQWASADVGAELKLSYANDQITGVVINGATLSVNNLTDRVDIGKYLKTGTNQLTVELSSTLNHRAGFEKDVSNIYSGGFGGATPSRYLENGLLGAVLIPYQDAPLTKEVPDPQNPAPPTPDPGTPHPDLPSVSIETVSIKSIAKQIYTGKQIRPAVSLTKDGKKLAASDYTIAYGANKKIGLGTVTIKGKGTFTGTRTLSFKIVPQKPTKLKVSAPGKNTLKITFNRVSKAQNIKKYRVLYRSKGALSWKYKTVTVKLTGRDGARTTASVTLKNLQKGKVYQIRVYAFAGNCKGYPTGIRTKTVQ